MKVEIEKETRKFFKDVIDLAGTYFLSDYIQDYGEFDSSVVSKEKHNEIVSTRNRLKIQCEKVGLNIHIISCEVAQAWIEEVKVEIEVENEWNGKWECGDHNGSWCVNFDNEIVAIQIDWYTESPENWEEIEDLVENEILTR